MLKKDPAGNTDGAIVPHQAGKMEHFFRRIAWRATSRTILCRAVQSNGFGFMAFAGLGIMALAATLAGCSTGTGAHQVSLAAARIGPTPSPAAPQARTASTAHRAVGRPMVGVASWYERGPHLHRTCSGAPLRNDRLTAASPVLPTGTRARVSLVHGNRAVVVKVNDCMPRSDHRLIDLSVAAARRLHIIKQGIAKVRVTPIGPRPVQISSR